MSDLKEAILEVEPALKFFRYRSDPTEVRGADFAAALGELDPERLLPIPSKVEKEFIFAIDETGDPAANFKDGSSELFVTACLAFPIESLDHVNGELRNLVQALHMGKEIKSTSLDRLKPKWELSAKDTLDKLLRDHAQAVWAVAQWKEGSHKEINLQDIDSGYRGNKIDGLNEKHRELADDGGRALLQLSSQVIFTNIFKFAAQQSGKGTVLFDRMNKAAKNKEIEDAFQITLSLAKLSREDSHLTLKLVDSKGEPLVWLADYVGKEVLKRLQGFDSRWEVLKGLLPTHIFGSDGHFVATVDTNGRYGFWDLHQNEVICTLPD